MSNKPTYEELEQRVKELEQDVKSFEDSELLFSSFLNQSPFPTWVSDTNGLMIDTNPALLKTINVTREQVVNVYNVFDDPQIGQELQDGIRKVLSDGIVFNTELEWAGEDTDYESLKEAKRVYIEGTVFPMKNSKDEPTNAVITYKDVSGKKLAELALEKSENHHKTVLDTAPRGIYTVTPEGTFESVNSTMEKLTGYAMDELLTQSFGILSPKYKTDQKNVEFSNALSGNDVSGIVEIVHKDGKHRNLAYDQVFKDDLLVGIVSDVTNKIKTQQALKDSEETYRNIFKHSQVGLYRTEPATGTIIDVNDALARIAGFKDRNELLKDQWNIAEHYVDIKDRLKIIEQLTTKGSFVNEVALLKDRHGVQKWLRMSGMLTEKGVIEGVAENITEVKKAEDALKESEEKFRTLFDDSPEPMALSVIETGKLIDVNKSFCKIFQLTKDEYIGKTSAELGLYLNPKDRDDMISRLRRNGIALNYEITAVKKDCTSVIGLLSFSVVKVSSQNRILSSFKNISEIRLTQQALADSERKHRTLVGAIDGGISLIREDGTYLYANDISSGIFGMNTEDIIGRNVRDIFSEKPDFIEKELQLLNQVLSTGEGIKHERYVEEIDRWFSESIQPVKNEIGDCFAIQVLVTDITERKQAEEQIKESLKEKETLLQEVHHRVKNNMQIIISLLNLQSNNIEDNQIKEILKDSQSRVFAMSAVHETLHGSEKLSEIDLKAYLSKITPSVFQTYSIDHRKVKLNSNVDNSPISINQAYPLGLVINELISNSLKYAFPADRTGEITVNLKKLDEELELIVLDNGVGMPDGLDWKNSISLGLKLVRTLVENQLDGSIDMENSNGTKFTIKFNIES